MVDGAVTPSWNEKTEAWKIELPTEGGIPNREELEGLLPKEIYAQIVEEEKPLPADTPEESRELEPSTVSAQPARNPPPSWRLIWRRKRYRLHCGGIWRLIRKLAEHPVRTIPCPPSR